MKATAPQSFETSAFDAPGLSFTAHLPATAAFGPGGQRRDFSRLEGLLGYLCDVANALRQSVTTAELEAWGRQLTGLLQAAVDGSLAHPSEEFLAKIGAGLEEGVRWSRRLERGRAGVTLKQHADIQNADGLYALAAALLMHRKHRGVVRLCPQCGKFFVRTGKRVFCSGECSTAANNAGVLDRQKNQRRRRAAQELLPHIASRAKREAAVKQAFKEHPDATTPEQLAEYAKALLRPSRRHK